MKRYWAILFNHGKEEIKIILVVESKVEARAALEKTFKDRALSEKCVVGEFSDAKGHHGPVLFVGDQNELEMEFFLDVSEKDVFLKPLRLGTLLDRIGYYIHRNTNQDGHILLPIGPYDLDVTHNCLIIKDSSSIIRLTEKERHILELLYENSGVCVSRRMLLDHVWAYAEDIETHTLETHIYRLRQKMEKDPANPKFLLTDERGYRLEGEN